MRFCLVPALLCAGLAAGCGNDRFSPPDPAVPAAAEGTRVVVRPSEGLRFRVPRNWRLLGRDGRRVASIVSGRAVVAVWRYPRRETLPADDAALRDARRALLERVRARDPRFRLRSARLRTVAGARAVEVRGVQHLTGLSVATSSTHLYDEGAEVVVDALAPPEHFARVDRTVVRPLLRSLRVSGPRRR